MLKRTLSVAAALGLWASVGQADQFHYNNVPVGTRAVGMGGAFGGVADDASGVFYNPAGLAFALSNDIQGSANAFYKKKTTYESTLCGDDFVEDSSGSLTPFFGGLQKLDRYVEGMVFAFGVYYVDGDLKDQDTQIDDKVCNSVTIERYHRTSNARASTYYAGAAVGYRPTTNMAVGFGLNYFNADELVQEYQDAKQTVPIKLADGSTTTGWRILDSNVREHLVVHGVQPVLGFQAALPAGFTVGLTIKKGLVASQKFDSTSETRTATLLQGQKDDLDAKGAVGSPGAISESITDEKSDKPVGSWPTEIRLGTAWFASPTLLLAFDVTHYTAVTDAGDLESNGNRPRYNRDAVTNFALGSEWYVAPSFPLRFGVFTNNDARPKVNKGTPDDSAAKTCTKDKDFAEKYCGQPDHIDYLGESLFIAWVQPNSQIAGGVTLQQGKGQAQKLGDHQIQDVKSAQTSFAFSATHNL